MSGSAPEDVITLPQAAALLGVGPTTLKRWTDQGRIPHTRTPGGHRRFLRSVVMDFRSLVDPRAGLSRGPGALAVRLGTPREWVERAQSLSDPDRMEAALLAARADRHDWGEVGDAVLSEFLEGLRGRLLAGTLSPGAARCVRRSMVRALFRAAGRHRPRTGAPVALLAAPGGEEAEVLLAFAETILREREFSVVDAGASTEPEVLQEVITEQGPHVVVLVSDRHSDAATVAVRLGGVERVALEGGAGLWFVGGAPWPVIGAARRLPTLSALSIAARRFRPDDEGHAEAAAPSRDTGG